jgi:type I restriction enzyme S subunit
MNANPGQLPRGWTIATIEDVADINPGLDKAEYDNELDVSFVPMSSLEAETGLIDVSQCKKFGSVKKGFTVFREGDVLFAKITPCMENGKMGVVPALRNDLGFGSTEFHVIRPFTGVAAKYLYYFVSSKRFRFDAEHNMSGAVGQRRVPTPYLRSALVPLPPSGAQHRIVTKIEELFSELDKGVESLKTAQEQLKVYRQAVLKHAFEGKLTERWRTANKDKLEAPNQLLARIRSERESRYQRELAHWKFSIKDSEAKEEKTRKPAKPTNTESVRSDFARLPDLPTEWICLKIGNLNAEIFDGPFGSNLKSSDYVDKGVRVIRLENIGNLQFIEAVQVFFCKFREGDFSVVVITLSG